MNIVSVALPLHADPLGLAIAEFHISGQSLSEAQTDAEMERLSLAFTALLNWTAPATSLDSALAALRLAQREMKMDQGEDGLAGVMLEVAMAFLDATEPGALQRQLTRRAALYLSQ